ncbi:MAG TPA: Rrf2 family transcriptional regulator [Candidatus Acidoferrales bacterium]|nr:Rrf2 family transcriptional regulator [Candidatus Acidoferrales bacterium]
MLKLTKKADYGLIAMRHLAEHPTMGACSAKDLAELYSIPQEALAKILQRLAKAKLLVSQKGTDGGYALARDPKSISALEVIRAIEGPLFLTSCSLDKGDCGQSHSCTVREPLLKVSRTIEEVLSQLTVWELTGPAPETHVALVTLGSAERNELITGQMAASVTGNVEEN